MTKFCQNCGKELLEDAEFCLNCGKSVKKESLSSNKPVDGNGFAWGILGFLFPLVGLILFIVWKKDRPKASKGAGLGALIGFVLGALSVVLSFLFFTKAINFTGSIDKNNKCAEAYCYSCTNGSATCVYYDDDYEAEYITCDCSN